MGPVAARAERLVHARLRRERRQHESCTWRCRRRARSRSSRHEPRARRESTPMAFRWRSYVLSGPCWSCAALLPRCGAPSICSSSTTAFLAKEGNARFSREVQIAAHRGTITDRYGEPLAVSTPVDSIWANPQELALASDQIPRLAAALKKDRASLTRLITSNLDREFLYLARHRQPAEAQKIKALGIPGVYLIARVPPLLPGGRSGGARARIHQRRRCRAGRPRAGVRPLAGRRERPQAHHPGPLRPGGAGRREHPAGAAGPRPRAVASTCASSTSRIAS